MAENIGAMASGQNVREYLASVLRGTILVHATRRYEFSSILRGRSLLTEEDLMSFICNRADADMSLSRRATSEGRIPFGAESQAFIIAGRSNIADTFEGGQYFQEFTASLDVLASGFDEQGRPVSGVMDADLLDRIWGELRRIKGFGAMQNDGVADGPKSLGGFILKNIVFQGLRCFVPDGIGLHVGPRCCEVSSDKVLILNNSRRRPLMIDAQSQAQSFRIDLECTLW